MFILCCQRVTKFRLLWVRYKRVESLDQGYYMYIRQFALLRYSVHTIEFSKFRCTWANLDGCVESMNHDHRHDTEPSPLSSGGFLPTRQSPSPPTLSPRQHPSPVFSVSLQFRFFQNFMWMEPYRMLSFVSSLVWYFVVCFCHLSGVCLLQFGAKEDRKGSW